MRQLRSWQDQGRSMRDTVLRCVSVFRNMFPMAMPTPRVADHALNLAARYSLSHWDSMLLGACKEAAVTTLYQYDEAAKMVDELKELGR